MGDVRGRGLLAFAREVQRAITFEELLAIAHAEVASALGYETAWLFIAADDDARELRLLDATGSHRGEIAKAAPTLRVEANRLLQELMQSNEPVVVADARVDPRADKALLERLGNRTMINVPLRLLDRPFGAFGTGTFAEEGPRPPTPEQLDHLVGMASQLSMAAARIRRRLAEDAADRAALVIENALVVDELEERVARRTADLEEANRALRALQAELESLVDARTLEIRNANEALRQSEARKTAVMEAALDAIVLMDAAGAIIEFNAAAERTFGYARHEVVGRPLAEVLIPPALRGDHVRGLQTYLATGLETVLGQRLELSALRKDGTEFPAEIAIVRIRSDGAPVFTGYIRDITHRRQAAEAEILRREKEAAEAANRELEAFSYSVAHDLRSPLRGINGFSNALLDDYGDTLDAGAKALLRRVTASSERMGHIIDALLSLARLSTSELRHETVDLAPMARSIVEQLRAGEPQRSVELVLPETLPARGDADLLRAVLDNLLGNAWKFTRNTSGARIELGAAPSPEGTRYFVRDNGAGFDMAFASRLFSPFQRLHSADQFEGTGVGLATVQRIIRRHGGRVWAESKEGEGAVFQFTLPDGPWGHGVSWRPRA